jgi:GAF domain-containing protein
LKREEIPIGARILSVVDCFDALTSDRPYRPALSDHDALAILMERRGTMYDPLIVDTFVRVYAEIGPAAAGSSVSREVLSEITGSTQPLAAFGPRPLEAPAAVGEAVARPDLTWALARPMSVGSMADVAFTHLRRLISFTQAALFLYDVTSDELVVEHTAGEAAGSISGLRVPLGQRLSGWVAANRQAIVNSDPTLDLGEAARAPSSRLQSCLSVPAMSGDRLVAVLTIYSTSENGFSDADRKILDAVAQQLAIALVAFEEEERVAVGARFPQVIHAVVPRAAQPAQR